jgi:hypothetical protein
LSTLTEGKPKEVVNSPEFQEIYFGIEDIGLEQAA